jgi:hypothetical protein
MPDRYGMHDPALSYAQAVADYQAEYRRRWAHFRRTGERLP